MILFKFISFFERLIDCLNNIETTKIWTWEYKLFSGDHWFGCVIEFIEFTIKAEVSAKTVNQLRLVGKSSVSAVGLYCCIASARNYWWIVPSCCGEPGV